MAFIRVGKIKDAHGIRGELFVVLFAGEADWLSKMTELRLVRDNASSNQVASSANTTDAKMFSVKSARAHKNGLIVKSADIKDRNEAELLKGMLLEIPDEWLVSEKGESIFLREIQGFMLKNRGENVGVVERFSSNTVQDLLVVPTAKGEFEIPFVEAFVKKVDYEARVIDMDLPHGLLGEEDQDEVQDGQDDDSVED